MSTNYQYSPQPTTEGDHSYITTLLLAFFLGPFGVHRFYTGYVGIGIAQILLTLFLGLGALWALVDVISIALNKYVDADGNSLKDHNQGCGLMVLIYLVMCVVLLVGSIFMTIMLHS